MSVENKEDVDRICTTASENGGKIDPTILKQMDGMYGRSFEDPDGHVSPPSSLYPALALISRVRPSPQTDSSPLQ